MNRDAIKKALDQFPHLRVMVIGDVILDAYYRGSVNRISPEAPVSVLDVHSREYRLGGAANVALNIKKLGAEPLVFSVVGDDEAGAKLFNLFEREGISTGHLIRTGERRTSVKTRLMSGHHQLLRMDEEQCDNLDVMLETELLKLITASISDEKISVILFQDYDKGCISPVLIGNVMELAMKKGIPTAVDPKKRNFLSYSGATLFKPNLRELRDGLFMQELESDRQSLENAFRQLNDVMPIQMALFTLSHEGMLITDGDRSHHVPARAQNISDVSGAGDTVISVAACALAAGLGMEEIAAVSNLAGGWVCQYPGVVPIELAQLKREMDQLKH